MSNFFRELDQKELVETAKGLHELGVRREWQQQDEYAKETTVTYMQKTRPEIFRYQGEYMEADQCYFIPSLEDAIAFLLQREFAPTIEFFKKGKWRITWTVGGFAEGITPRLAAIRAMEEILKAAKESEQKEEEEEF
ncbi:MAG: hypothetical protein JNN15_12350 [Blastocatellia bacterium]|nr:hypothetical protein [Blastocatellia bacterium]